MVIKLIFLIILVILNAWIMTVHVTDKNCTKRLYLTGITLWILGLYLGLVISTLFN